MATREEIVKQNLEFVYGKNEQAKLEDPDKVSYRAPKTKFVDSDAIVDFTGEFEFLAPSFPCPVFLQGEKLLFPSFEHALLASKFKTEDKRQEVRATPLIRDVKRLISREKGKTTVLHGDWTERCIAIAEVLLLDKFIRNRKLKEQLMKTGRRTLMFKNDFSDLYWGVDEQRKGQNNLGKLLEKIRTCIDQGNDLELWLSHQVKLIETEKVQVTMTVSKDGVPVAEDCRVIEQRPKLLIGKSEDMCDICAAHPTISRVHAALLVERQTGTLYVVDLASANGTKIDGQPLNPFELTPLGAGSILTMGVSNRQYSFTVDAAADEKRKAALLKKIAADPASLLPGANPEKHTENTVFVGNISFDTPESEITAFFAPCGTITQLSVPMDRASGKHKGIAFVTFADFKGVMQALARDNDELGGRNVKVKKSDARKPGQVDGRRENRAPGGAGSGAGGRGTAQGADMGTYGLQRGGGSDRADVKTENSSRGEGDRSRSDRSRSPVRRTDDVPRRPARSPSRSRSPAAHRRNGDQFNERSERGDRGRTAERSRSPARRSNADRNRDSRDRARRPEAYFRRDRDSRPRDSDRDSDRGRDGERGMDRNHDDRRKRQRSRSASGSPPRRAQRRGSPSRSPARNVAKTDRGRGRERERSGSVPRRNARWSPVRRSSPSRNARSRSRSPGRSPPRYPAKAARERDREQVNRKRAEEGKRALSPSRSPSRPPRQLARKRDSPSSSPPRRPARQNASPSPSPPRRQIKRGPSASRSPSPPRRPAGQPARHTEVPKPTSPSASASPSPPRRNSKRSPSPSPPRRPADNGSAGFKSATRGGASPSPSPPRRTRQCSASGSDGGSRSPPRRPVAQKRDSPVSDASASPPRRPGASS